jgi:uncharacterized protein (DUF1697 family)
VRWVVLLRGVNVGGHNRIAMQAFRDLLDGLGCTDVATYVQSGNAVVTWDGTAEDLRRGVESALRDSLELPVSVLTRTSAELDAVVDGNPLEVDPTMLHAVFLAEQPEPTLVDPTSLLPDRVAVGDRVVYVRYVDGSHRSAAAKLFSSKRFPIVASARNWRTVLALQQLAHGGGAEGGRSG